MHLCLGSVQLMLMRLEIWLPTLLEIYVFFFFYIYSIAAVLDLWIVIACLVVAELISFLVWHMHFSALLLVICAVIKNKY